MNIINIRWFDAHNLFKRTSKVWLICVAGICGNITWGFAVF